MADCNSRIREAILTFDLLEGDERSEVEAHLRECPSCASRLDWIREIEAKARRLAAGVYGAHPSAAALYDFAAGPGADELGPEDRRVTAAHVERCEDCTREVRRIREVNLEDPRLVQLLHETGSPESTPEQQKVTLTRLLQTAPHPELPPEPSPETFTVRPRPRAPRETLRRILFPLAAAAAVILSIVLLPKEPVPPPDAWVVLSPGTSAVSEIGEDRQELHAGDRIPSDRRVVNPGPETLVLAQVVENTREPARACFLEPGESLEPGGSRHRLVPIPNLTAFLLRSPAVPNPRGAPVTSRLLYPRLTIRSRRPDFTFLPRPGEGAHRAVLYTRTYPEGQKEVLFATAPSSEFTLFFPKDEPSLLYDVAKYFEWTLEEEADGSFREIESVEFYLHSSPATVEVNVQNSREALASQPKASHYFVAQLFLREQLFLAALQELLKSDPELSDPGVIDLSRRIARNLGIDLDPARQLIPILPLR